MTDAGLRELMRRVETEGSASARLALAAALERVGCQEEALRALLPGRDDLQVRVEVARLAGIVEAPVRRQPVERWRHVLGPGGSYELLAATPLGVALQRFRSARTSQIQIHDPEEGRIRWRMDWPIGRHEPQIVDGLLACWDWAAWVLVVRDLWTGDELHETRLDQPGPGRARVKFARVVADQLLAWTPDEVRAYPLAVPRSRPGPVAWRTELALDARLEEEPGSCVRAARGALLLRARGEPESWWVLDAATGVLGGRIAGHVVHADELGVIIRRLDGGLEAREEPLAAASWSKSGTWVAGTFADRVLLNRASAESTGLFLADRATGEVIQQLVSEHNEVDSVVRGGCDVLLLSVTGYGSNDWIQAWTSAGEQLWGCPRGLESLAPLVPGRLVGFQEEELVCLEEPPP